LNPITIFGEALTLIAPPLVGATLSTTALIKQNSDADHLSDVGHSLHNKQFAGGGQVEGAVQPTWRWILVAAATAVRSNADSGQLIGYRHKRRDCVFRLT
jgi:hypothetical protein